jgi:Fe-S-cluster-containing dehydrogenase component
MSVENAFIVNTEDCVCCYACEIACKQEHNLPAGLRWIRVHSSGYWEIEGKLKPRYKVIHCMHCSHPSCSDVCSVEAITKRDDGIVLINEERCIGCGDCIEACPLGVMQFDEDKKVVQKCDLCMDRLDRGLQPSCVAACPSHCIYWGDKKEIAGKLQEKKLLVRYKDVTI